MEATRPAVLRDPFSCDGLLHQIFIDEVGRFRLHVFVEAEFDVLEISSEYSSDETGDVEQRVLVKG